MSAIQCRTKTSFLANIFSFFSFTSATMSPVWVDRASGKCCKPYSSVYTQYLIVKLDLTALCTPVIIHTYHRRHKHLLLRPFHNHLRLDSWTKSKLEDYERVCVSTELPRPVFSSLFFLEGIIADKSWIIPPSKLWFFLEIQDPPVLRSAVQVLEKKESLIACWGSFLWPGRPRRDSWWRLPVILASWCGGCKPTGV